MPKGHLPVVSYLAVPVVSPSGEVLGGLFLGHDQPGRFEAETESLISAIARQTAVAMDNARRHKRAEAEIQQRRRAEEARELLLHELQHRVKNTLATIQGMVSQTFRTAPSEEREAFVARLHALAAAHDLLTQQGHQVVEVRSLVNRALRPFREGDPDRIVGEGSEARLNSNSALLLAMVLHELGTNAVKYGALSTPSGRVDLRWEMYETARDWRLNVVWRELGGPPVRPPSRKGFGSLMIERALRGQQGSASFEFAPEGVICTLEIVAFPPRLTNADASGPT
jgi:two-component sensor histidine kinase